MSQIPEYCPYYGDIEGCSQNLIGAYKKGRLKEHCIIEGLRNGCTQCEYIVRAGLYQPVADKYRDKLWKGEIKQKKELEEVCKELVLRGYQWDIRKIYALFADATHHLITYYIYKRLRRSSIIPVGYSGNYNEIYDELYTEIYSETYKNLFQRFNTQEDIKINCKLSTYVTSACGHICSDVIKNAIQRKFIALPEDIEDKRPNLSPDIRTAEMFDIWKHFDKGIQKANKNKIIGRIILAQQCIYLHWTSSNVSVRQLKEFWSRLFEYSEIELEKLYKRISNRFELLEKNDIIYTIAEMLDENVISIQEIPVAFAVATDKCLKRVRELIKDLTELSNDAIAVRIHRMYKKLQQNDRPP